ncbi:F0F1 ATP synthase subunit epsilon [Streptomyces sp. NPDC006992]|uniref:F0F1 ATP synthase subunit epsilon n=1 Tax=Streptomyces TaxID=1883 RepID=UPI0023EB89A0|nr:F0F1 ATP synthase subunit epsilon [Streptomyces sp. WMMB303]MDF4253387.1 F0F1 ATP synthase subunit epsilon [Streptomyces sp. WMMB303]
MAELHVELVAADRKVWSGEASLVVARTSSGDIGVMPGHQPLLGVLESGPVTIRTTGESGNGTVVAAVHGGFISFADNQLSLLAEVAELTDEIDVERAERALEDAKSQADADAEKRADVRLRSVTAAR